jgi:hypothetical protein
MKSLPPRFSSINLQLESEKANMMNTHHRPFLASLVGSLWIRFIGLCPCDFPQHGRHRLSDIVDTVLLDLSALWPLPSCRFG